MDFRHGLLFMGLALSMTACSQPEAEVSGFQELSSQCSSLSMPQQFVVKHTDGSTEIIHAVNEEAFRATYMVDHAADIKFAEHDYHVKQETPKVKAFETAPGVTTADNWGPAKVHADAMWAQAVTGVGVTIAVVDSGMDITHPQLAPQLALNPGENGLDSSGHNKATNQLDDDGNGFVDDAAGYDFIMNQPLTGDYQYHGTHVSGTLGALHHDTVAQSESYVQGMAPGAKILPLAFLDQNGSGSMSDGVRAIRYAVTRGARVINASWGGSVCSESLKQEIAELQNQDVIFVNAAGNDAADVDNVMEYPASLNLLAQLTVGATGDHDYMATWSNYGAKAVHIFAPGADIVSTIPGGMGILSGTSMATPMVSGAVALLLSAVPSATLNQVRMAIYNSAVHNSDYVNVSQGRLDMTQALSQLRSQVADAQQ